jgi:DNA primase
MSTTTEDIKARLNIVEVIGQYVRLQKAGSSWKANCPFHQEKTPSFNVNEERQMWHCFGCGKGGDVFAFVMESEGIDFKEALRLLAERAGVELPAYRGGGPTVGETRDRSLEILDLATKFYEKQLWESDRGKKMLAYLRDRGLSDDSLRAFRLGYAPEGWRFVLEFLLKRGYAADEIERAGLVVKKERGGTGPGGAPSSHYDRFRDRIMFPIGDVLGRVIGYSARVAPGGDETQAKYVNTPETVHYHKSRALYGLHLAKQAIKESGGTVLVEGNMDVIALHQAGVRNTVAVSGTALTPEQLTLLKRYGKSLALFFDMDKAGQAAAWKSARAALEADFSVTAIALTHGKDAADMNREDPTSLVAAVRGAVPVMRYFLDALLATEEVTPEGKRRIVERYAELLAAVPNTLERAHWTKELAAALDADPKVVQASVEHAFRSLHRGDAFLPDRRPAPFLPKSFGRRSEMLRENIIGLMYAVPATKERILSEADELVAGFLAEHPLAFFLRNVPDDPVGAIEDQALQQELSRITFRVLELPSLAGKADEELRTAALAVAEEYLAEVRRELRDKDQLADLGRAIEAARQAGDRERERTLLTEFARLTRRTASQNE